MEEIEPENLPQSIEEAEIVWCLLKNKCWKMAYWCPECYSLVKYVGICHSCPLAPEYQNEAERKEHREFLDSVVEIWKH
jgi:hypothetical protein